MRAPPLRGRGELATGMEAAIRFIDWARSHPTEITAQAIQARFGVSIATGYRWRHAWYASQGKYPPTKKGSSR
ncbi:hypothetical protein [Pinirhizobacter sp.]|jgi:hypothetical protein|uniref:hypothetical protein n=1 Tax=Pinirhizobacter sp. TaxID=2950432 RepID=UPI002F3ECEFB